MLEQKLIYPLALGQFINIMFSIRAAKGSRNYIAKQFSTIIYKNYYQI